MANKTATVTVKTAYTGPNGESVAPPQTVISAPYQSQTVSTIDIPDATAAGTVFALPMGAVNNANLVIIENKTTQSLRCQTNPPATASGVLSSGVVVLNLDNDVGDFLFAAAIVPGGTPSDGYLIERVTASTVRVTGILKLSGTNTADTSVVLAVNPKDGYMVEIPPGGMEIPLCAATVGNFPVSGMNIKTTATQTGVGLISCKVFGDPT